MILVMEVMVLGEFAPFLNVVNPEPTEMSSCCGNGFGGFIGVSTGGGW